MSSLAPEERQQQVDRLDGWVFDPGHKAISKRFVFATFVEAFGFMSSVALLAERADHHPEWSNVYDRVDIMLTTHDACGVSMRDIEFAQSIDRLRSA